MKKNYWGCDKNEEIKVNKQGFVSAKKLCFCNEIFVTYTNFVSSWYIQVTDTLVTSRYLYQSAHDLILRTDTRKEVKYLLGKLIFFISHKENILPELIFLGNLIGEWKVSDRIINGKKFIKLFLTCNLLESFMFLKELNEFFYWIYEVTN